MADKQKILIVDDDENIAELISLYLEKECYETRIENDGVAAVNAALSWKPDLMVLDLMLPGKDGYQVCREVRQSSHLPIIMLSAKTEVFDKVLGLELGADDYMVKPFDSKELVARVKALLRRSGQIPAAGAEESEPESMTVSYPGLTVSLGSYTCTVDGIAVDMAPKEIELLYCLATSPNRVFIREQLLNRVWGYNYAGDGRTVDVHIKRIREKLGEHERWSIATVWGIGYRFEDRS